MFKNKDFLAIWKTVLLITIYVFSGIATFYVALNCFSSIVIALAISFIVESIKVVASLMYHKEKNKKWIIAYIALWIFYAFVSILFSSASILDTLDEKEKINKYASNDYKQIVNTNSDIDKERQSLQTRYDTLSQNQKSKVDIIRGESEYNNQKASLTKELVLAQKRLSGLRSELSDIPVTSKTQRLRNDKEAEIKQQQTIVSSLEKQISSLSPATGNSTKDSDEMQLIMSKLKELRTEKENKNIDFEKSDNYSSWFRRIVKNISFNEVIFWILFSIFLEIAGWLLLRGRSMAKADIIQSKPKSNVGFTLDKSPSPAPIMAKADSAPAPKMELGKSEQISTVTVDADKPKQVIGFKAPEKEQEQIFTDADYERWKAYVRKHAKQEGEMHVALGVSTVAKALKIPQKTALAIAGECARKGITKAQGNKTIILKMED